MRSIQENLQEIHSRIKASCDRYSREKSGVALLCVTKTKPQEKIIEAYNCGERHFGESYAVEAAEKISHLKDLGYKDIVWHFIGPIQKNKTRLIAQHFDIVESLDREIVARRLNEQRPDDLKPLEVLIQVNLSDEDQKSGCAFDEVDHLIEVVTGCPKLKLRGFMGVGTDTPDLDLISREFALLKTLFDKYHSRLPNFDILSLGMTHDLEQAIENGSTEVRIGTAIFGAREYRENSMTSNKVAFIGGGNMASCIYSSLIKEMPAQNVTVSGPHLKKLEKFKAQGSAVTTDNLEAVKNADVIFLGVKPQILTEVLNEIAASGVALNHKLFISMAAGYRISSIEKILNTRKIIRIMPNTPAKLGLGVVAVVYGAEVSDNEKSLCLNMLKNMGECIEGDEQALNVIGVIAGCGPAFVYRFMEAMINESTAHGLDEASARKIVEQTVLGAASLVRTEQDSSIASLREAVTSKGGTTFAGLTKMTEGNFDGVITDTVNASLNRTYEFEKMF